MIEYLTRNDVKVSIADSPVTADGKTLPAGAAVVSMYQAKRSVANAALYREPLITSWETMSNGASGSFNYIRGFDMVTCVIRCSLSCRRTLYLSLPVKREGMSSSPMPLRVPPQL